MARKRRTGSNRPATDAKSRVSDRLTTRNNNFDALRLTVAILVVCVHSYALSGSAPRGSMIYNQHWSTLVVGVFFIISGFLVTSSWFNRRSLGSFLKARALRIFPGLGAVVVIAAFIMGPLVTTLPLAAYLRAPQTWFYLSNVTLYGVNYLLPGVFAHNPYPAFVNGSLWTLEYEFTCYLVVAALGRTGCLNALTVGSLFLMSIIGTSVRAGFGQSIYGFAPFYAVQFSMYFFAGSILYFLREIIPLDGRLALCATIAPLLVTAYGGVPGISFVFCVSYLVMYLAFAPWLRTASLFHRIGDFSYGLYVVAFPVQQVLAWAYHGHIGLWRMLAFSLSISLALAVLSWYGIEKKVLAFKSSMARRKTRTGVASPESSA